MPKKPIAPVTLFRGALGLNNKLPPTRIMFDPETGLVELSIAYNVDIDNRNRVSRRAGFAATTRTESSHSLFCEGGYCLFVAGTGLFRLNSDFTRTGLRNVTPNARVSYVQVDGVIYYANGYENGRILQDGTSWTWPVGDYVGPTTKRQLSAPPVGHLLELFNGRMLIAEGKNVWHSEPFAYSLYDLTRNYWPFETKVLMLRAVEKGVYVSDSSAVYFLAGDDATEVKPAQVASVPAIPGTDVVVDGAKIGKGEIKGKCVMWTSNESIMLGLPDGRVESLTEDKLVYPSAVNGAAIVQDRKYIALLEE